MSNNFYNEYNYFFGKDNTSGSYGYQILKVDKENCSYTIKAKLSDWPKKNNGMWFSLYGEETHHDDEIRSFDCWGQVLKAEENEEGNLVVYVSEKDFYPVGIPFHDTKRCYLYLPEYPSYGSKDIVLGNYTLTFGTGNKTPYSHSYTGGMSNKNFGRLNHVEGTNNFVGASYSHIEGTNNEVHGSRWVHMQGRENYIGNNSKHSCTCGFGNRIEGDSNSSFAMGQYNEIINGADCAFTLGRYLIASKYEQVVVGGYNVDNPDAKFIVGTGDKNGRKNGLEIYKDGSFVVGPVRATASSLTFGDNQLSGTYPSVAFGTKNIAEGNYTLCHGYNNHALGNYSFTLGIDNIANNAHNILLGRGLQGKRNYQVAIGSYNKISKGPLFMVGNGKDNEHRSNAFEVFDNSIKIGNTIITEEQLQKVLALID